MFWNEFWHLNSYTNNFKLDKSQNIQVSVFGVFCETNFDILTPIYCKILHYKLWYGKCLGHVLLSHKFRSVFFTLINFGLFYFQIFAKCVLILSILTSQRQLLGYVQIHLQRQDLQVKTQWIFVELWQSNIVRVFKFAFHLLLCSYFLHMYLLCTYFQCMLNKLVHPLLLLWNLPLPQEEPGKSKYLRLNAQVYQSKNTSMYYLDTIKFWFKN